MKKSAFVRNFLNRTIFRTRAYARGLGDWGKIPAWAWYFTKTLLPAQRSLIVFAYFFVFYLST